ncbi:hypothetical protein LOTGIDRAFT_101900, partial [Lottia gigantea]
ICLLANSTHLLQPLHVAFYGPLKRYWRKVIDNWKSSSKNTSRTLNKDSFPMLPTKLYDLFYPIEDLQSENIISGFRKCGIMPFSPDIVLQRL